MFLPPPAWDLRVDAEGLAGDPQGLRHAKHQVLMRAYQARYMLLPDETHGGSIVERLQRHYDPTEMAALEVLRHGLEAELLGGRRQRGAQRGGVLPAVIGVAPPTMPMIGEKNAETRNSRPTAIEVRPVRPPSATPEADSM